MSDSEDDDIPQLSSHALAALQEFYAEQKQSTIPGRDDKYNVGVIEENWVSPCDHVGEIAVWHLPLPSYCFICPSLYYLSFRN